MALLLVVARRGRGSYEPPFDYQYCEYWPSRVDCSAPQRRTLHIVPSCSRVGTGRRGEKANAERYGQVTLRSTARAARADVIFSLFSLFSHSQLLSLPLARHMWDRAHVSRHRSAFGSPPYFSRLLIGLIDQHRSLLDRMAMRQSLACGANRCSRGSSRP